MADQVEVVSLKPSHSQPLFHQQTVEGEPDFLGPWVEDCIARGVAEGGADCAGKEVDGGLQYSHRSKA